jgi:predicted RNA-binding Zn-ribbon protein involved in translation (DUF1610 family)
MIELDIVGSFDYIKVIQCEDCDANTVELADSSKDYSVWECPKCGNVNHKPRMNHGVQFKCPDCEEDNVHVHEPCHISDSLHGSNLTLYILEDAWCYCGAEFELYADPRRNVGLLCRK